MESVSPDNLTIRSLSYVHSFDYYQNKEINSTAIFEVV